MTTCSACGGDNTDPRYKACATCRASWRGNYVRKTADRKKQQSHKATNLRMTEGYLTGRAEICIRKGFTKPKWIGFCETMLKNGYTVELYEARQTVSKYVTVIDEADTGMAFKVRFSNHKPIESRELAGDCDFFVGHTNLGITTTREAISATWIYFKKCRKQMGS